MQHKRKVKKQTIVINGTVYDAATGLPVAWKAGVSAKPATKGVTMDVAKPKAKPAQPRATGGGSKAIHRTTQHSTTLRRGHLSAPKSKAAPTLRKKIKARPVATSPMISRFASHPQPLTKVSKEPIEAPKPAAKLQPKPAKPVKLARLDSREIKDKLIKNAEARVATAPKPTKKRVVAKKKASSPKSPKRFFSFRRIAAISAAVVLLSGYFTYINLPGISVGLAAAQSGVAAAYPRYQPDGYSFEGPVSAQPGVVEIRFKSNGGGGGYTIRQQASNWNSSAVLDNFVMNASKGKYSTTSQQGLTLYTYNNNVAWSNGGVFYTINGNPSLSPWQLIDIATSM